MEKSPIMKWRQIQTRSIVRMSGTFKRSLVSVAMVMGHPLVLAFLICLADAYRLDGRDLAPAKIVFKAFQVCSLSSFEVGCQLLTSDLNQILYVSLLLTSSTALANEGRF